MHIFSVVPNQTLWGCVIKCTIFEHFMFPFRSGLVFPTLLMAFAMLFGCRNATKTAEPSNIVWIKNQHAELFRIGQTPSDSFLEVYDAPNTRLCIGKFFWGRSARIEGYQKITHREKIVSLSAIHTGMLAEMGLAKSIVGVESKQYIAHPQIYASSITNSWQELAPGEKATFTDRIYIGPKLQDQLDAVAPKLDLTVDYGTLTVIAKPLFWLLAQVHKLVSNWGLAIILVTVIIKAIFFPLAQTSGRSMARMRNIAPRVKALQDRYKDNREELGKQMMELYKREKVNPLSGCLPQLVQLPVLGCLDTANALLPGEPLISGLTVTQ